MKWSSSWFEIENVKIQVKDTHFYVQNLSYELVNVIYST